MKESFEKLVQIAEKLRAPGGCPWDREQTFVSMKKCVLEEAQEVAEAIEKEDMENLKEELGDLLFTIVFISDIAREKGLFDLRDSIEGIKEKLIRRHPHVFGDRKAKNAQEAYDLFYEAKRKEKENKR